MNCHPSLLNFSDSSANAGMIVPAASNLATLAFMFVASNEVSTVGEYATWNSAKSHSFIFPYIANAIYEILFSAPAGPAA